ncbi:MAG: DUF1343 domain-containing protein [Candidatus Azobacteroides sp.]|nr:DUF1343 domain-containing protein [Candidatus Azobacteroides sp.]
MEAYLSELKGKKVGLVVNQTSVVGQNRTLLPDTLLSLAVDVRKIFAPEHGFRGDADAGETIVGGKDEKTGLPVVSLYGRNKKPSSEQLSDLDILVFDIQDVGVRFFTYISTMHYVMEACAENNKKLLILDRPNPNDYVDGPMLENMQKSFVGMHPIPVLHGLTVGELARMINGEKWLSSRSECPLKVIPAEYWKHGQSYSLPVKPSPNLPNDRAVALYPSLCFFEATRISVGRGTYFPFQVIGAPDKEYGSFSFTPESLPGFDKNPMHKNTVCYGMDLRNVNSKGGLTLYYLIDFYKKSKQGAAFFSSPSFMDKLAGTASLRKQIIAGKSEQEIRAGWKKALDEYKTLRKKYLLYPDY